MVKDQTSQGVSLHLTSTLSEVPAYLKENFRATLPVFAKVFGNISQLGELLKQLIQRGGIHAGVPAPAGGGDDNLIIPPDTPGTWPAGSSVAGTTNLDLDAVTSTVMTARIVDVINGVTGGCFTLSNIAHEVCRELADRPVYLQTSETSIQDYKARYGKDPLMPLSLSFFYLRDGAEAAAEPTQAVGSPRFQLLYGCRGLLAEAPPSLDSMPGVKAILEAYNAGSTPRDRVTEASYHQFVNRVVDVLRYTVNSRAYRASLFPSGTYATGKLFLDVPDTLRVYALRPSTTLATVLDVVDSSFQEEKIAELTGNFEGSSASPALATGVQARADERVKNIIDLNIMPVNVHALLRTMPLAPTYNYSYTFEEMACLFYGKSRNQVRSLNTAIDAGGADAPSTTREFFLKLILDPYAEVSMSQYGDETALLGTAGFVQRICRGDNDLGLGRPKFISDQLFNKVMFGSIYPMKALYDEAGPGGQVLRGRQNWGDPGTRRVAARNSSLDWFLRTANLFLLTVKKYIGPTGEGSLFSEDAAVRNEALQNLRTAAAESVSAYTREELPAEPWPFIPLNAEEAQRLAEAVIDAINPPQPDPSEVATRAKALAAFLRKQIAHIQSSMPDSMTLLGPGVGAVISTYPTNTTPTNTSTTSQVLNSLVTYISKEKPKKGQPAESQIKQVGFGDRKSLLLKVGKQRFDSSLIRNLFFITNVYRLTREKLSQELAHSRTIIQRGDDLVRPSMTEFGTNTQLGYNETANSQVFFTERMN